MPRCVSLRVLGRLLLRLALEGRIAGLEVTQSIDQGGIIGVNYVHDYLGGERSGLVSTL